jgi:hypothetical protein
MDDQQPVYENTESALNMEFLTFMKSLLADFEHTIRNRFDPDSIYIPGSSWKEMTDPDYQPAMDSRRRVFHELYGRYHVDTSSPLRKDDFTETQYAQLANIRLLGRRIFYTSEGYFGIGPGSMQKDDIVVVLNGATIPYVLRPMKIRNEFKLVESCYIHDVMDGKWYSTSERKRETFRLR